MKSQSFVAVLLAGAFTAAACASTPKTAAPAATPAAPQVSAPSTPAVAPAPAGAPGAGQPAGAAAAAGAPGAGRGGRGGTPPPPPIPAPAVMPRPVTPIISGTAPSPDPRVGLKPGAWDAGQAAWNMKLISQTPPLGKVLGATHSDLAFSGRYVIQGNYNGFEIYDIANPLRPVLVQSYLCPASQNDVSVFKNLVFMSSESNVGRLDCGFGGVPDPVSKDKIRGLRVFDISDVKKPKLVANVQTCRGSHTHTVVTQPGDKDNIYIYISGTSAVRSADELPGCADGGIDDPNTARFRLEVIKIPLASPEKSAIVSSPRIFSNLPARLGNPERDAAGARAGAAGAGAGRAAGGGAVAGAGAGAAGGAAAGAAGGGAAAAGRGGRGNAPPSGPNQCHDITVYPDVGLAGGACGGLGLLLDIRDAANPKRIDMVNDANMSFWHSATFSNDGKKILFSDEWGGGSAPRCRITDKLEWGANALFTIENGKMVFHSYYKMPAPQTNNENCVAHNGSLIPIPGRDVMVQAFYQGGLTIFDWTDIKHPKEIAFYDRGPFSVERSGNAGSWSAYWYNGVIVSSEIQRGLDIYELVASPLISQNEIDAAKTVRMDYWNVQEQRQYAFAPSFALVRAYVDQLERNSGLAGARIAAVRSALTAAEKQSGNQRKNALTALATTLNTDAAGAGDAAKVRLAATAVTDLANAQR